MKKQVTQFLLILSVIFTVVACKKEVSSEKKETIKETKVAQAVYEGVKTFDMGKSFIFWKGHKLIGTHTGSINLESGQLTFANGVLTNGEFVVDMNSIKATELMKDQDSEEEDEGEDDGEGGEHDDRDDLANHLKDADFFDVKAYPKATFVTTSISKETNGYLINGNMTIKDKTNPIQFPAKIEEGLFKAKITIDRTKFGVKYGSGSFFSNLGDNIIKDEFDLIISLKIK